MLETFAEWFFLSIFWNDFRECELDKMMGYKSEYRHPNEMGSCLLVRLFWLMVPHFMLMFNFFKQIHGHDYTNAHTYLAYYSSCIMHEFITQYKLLDTSYFGNGEIRYRILSRSSDLSSKAS